MTRCATFIALLLLASLARSTDAADRFLYSGQVVNERGEPVAGAKIVATHRLKGHGFGYIDDVETDADGKFSIDRGEALSGATASSVKDEPIQLDVKHDDYLPGRILDLHQIDDDKLTTLKVELKDGRAFKGRVVDQAGKGVAGAMVQAEFGDNYDARKAKLTAADGAFELRGLPDEDASLSAIVADSKQPPQSGRLEIEASKPADEIVLKLKPITLAPEKVVHELFGMKLIDVDEQVKTDFLLPAANGVMILDPGDTKRLNIGSLQRGNSFWMVGEQKVKNFDEFTKQLITELHQSPEKPAEYTCRVVYRFTRTDFTGTSTQYIQLTEKDLAEVKALEK